MIEARGGGAIGFAACYGSFYMTNKGVALQMRSLDTADF